MHSTHATANSLSRRGGAATSTPTPVHSAGPQPSTAADHMFLVLKVVGGAQAVVPVAAVKPPEEEVAFTVQEGPQPQSTGWLVLVIDGVGGPQMIPLAAVAIPQQGHRGNPPSETEAAGVEKGGAPPPISVPLLAGISDCTVDGEKGSPFHTQGPPPPSAGRMFLVLDVVGGAQAIIPVSAVPTPPEEVAATVEKGGPPPRPFISSGEPTVPITAERAHLILGGKKSINEVYTLAVQTAGGQPQSTGWLVLVFNCGGVQETVTIAAVTIPLQEHRGNSESETVATGVKKGGAPPRIPIPAGITDGTVYGEKAYAFHTQGRPLPSAGRIVLIDFVGGGQAVAKDYGVKRMNAAAAASLDAGGSLAIPKGENSIYQLENGKWSFAGERKHPLLSKCKQQAELTLLGMVVVAGGHDWESLRRATIVSPLLKESSYFKIRNGYDISALQFLFLSSLMDRGFIEVRNDAMRQEILGLVPIEFRDRIGFGFTDYYSSDVSSDEEEEED